MNGYQLTRQWFSFKFENSHKVSAAHTEFYFYLLDRWNRFGQKEIFSCPRVLTMEVLGIGSQNTYKRIYQDLIAFGFIEEVSKACNRYKEASYVRLSKTDTLHDYLSDTLPDNLNDILSDTIIELKNKGTKELKKEGGVKKVKESKKFIPPTLDEVQAYFIEKNYPIEVAQEALDYYTRNEWIKSNGMAVKDWKRTIDNNWQDKFRKHRDNRLRQSQSNGSSYNSQLPVDSSKIVNYGKGNGKCLYDGISKLWYEPLHNGYPPKEICDYAYMRQGNHSNYGDYVRWMIENDKTPMPPEDTRYFPNDWNFESYVLEQRAIVAASNL